MKLRLDDPASLDEAIRTARMPNVRALERELDTAARARHRAVAKLALSPTEARPTVELARDVLTRSGELAIAALIELELPPPEARLFALRTVVAASLSLKRRVSDWVQGSLTDRDELPVEPSAGEEETPAPERVCDVAVMELRRAHHLGEDATQAVTEQRAFLALTFEARTRLIDRLRKEKRWRPTASDLDEAQR